MTRSELVAQIQQKKSLLCVGLDTDLARLPKHLLHEKDPIFAFNRAIIDATKDFCVAYKPNTAFYEAEGTRGWDALQKTIDYIPKTHFTIADAKRGDIGNTSRLYAKAFFDTLGFDAVTVAPYMGVDSVAPFLEHTDKWVILLGLTSNAGSRDFQLQTQADGGFLYEKVIKTAQNWGNPNNLMFVVGATHPEHFAAIRALAPDYFFLVPGIGAQGGDMQAVVQNGKNQDFGLIINSSREILFASEGEDFAEAAARAAAKMQREMAVFFED